MNPKKKRCIKCNIKKPISFYHTSKRGTRNVCNSCRRIQRRLSDKLKREWLSKNSVIPTICECCGKYSDKIVLDHDHVTGEFRGWLCDSCNRSIGQLGDNLAGLQNAVKYLSKQRGNQNE